MAIPHTGASVEFIALAIIRGFRMSRGQVTAIKHNILSHLALCHVQSSNPFDWRLNNVHNSR
jgi:hypothetical protein